MTPDEEVEENPWRASWVGFFARDEMRALLASAYLDWPRSRSVFIDYMALHRHDELLAEHLLARPYEALAGAQEVLKEIDIPGADLASGAGSRPRLRVRVTNLPEALRLGVADLRMEHAGRLVSLTGVFQSVAPPAATLQDGLFLCQRCGNAVRVPQDEILVLQEPAECYEDQGGCGRKSEFKLIVTSHRGRGSLFIDTQTAMLQEPPEGIHGTRPPVRVPVIIDDDLCGSVLPSDRARVNGVVRVMVRKSANRKTNVFDYFVEVSSIERAQRDYDEIEPTPEEIEEFHRLAQRDDLTDVMVGSIAPAIHGMREVKLAVALQLFGGVAKDFGDGHHIRGDIHVLLVGDPGVAKSMIGGAAARLSPRGQIANALRTTVSGIVGGVDKMDRGLTGDGHVYVAGLATMCHKGLLYIDEIGIPKDEHLHGSLLEPLEQQTASLAMQGARGLVIKCEFALIASMNPEGGRFDPRTPLIEQIKLPPPIMERMDLIFAIVDEADEVRDTRLVESMLRTHAAGASIKRGERPPPDVEPELKPDFLRKYVAYAKRSIIPMLSEMADAKIKAKYQGQRRQRSLQVDAPVGASPRMVNTLIRLSEAAARMRLSATVEERDVDLAFKIYGAGWERLARNERGQIDVDLFRGGGYDMRESGRILKRVIRRLQEPDGVRGDDAVAEAMRHGVRAETAANFFGRWKIDGTLTETRGGAWKLTRPNEGRDEGPGSRPKTPPAPPAPTETPEDDGARRVRWS